VKSLLIRFAISTQYWRVTNRQQDGRTGRHLIILSWTWTVTVVNLVHFSRHPVVDAHLLCGHWWLVDLLHLRHRLFLTPELSAVFQVHDGVPGVIVHLAACLRVPVCTDIESRNGLRFVHVNISYNLFLSFASVYTDELGKRTVFVLTGTSAIYSIEKKFQETESWEGNLWTMDRTAYSKTSIITTTKFVILLEIDGESFR